MTSVDSTLLRLIEEIKRFDYCNIFPSSLNTLHNFKENDPIQSKRLLERILAISNGINDVNVQLYCKILLNECNIQLGFEPTYDTEVLVCDLIPTEKQFNKEIGSASKYIQCSEIMSKYIVFGGIDIDSIHSSPNVGPNQLLPRQPPTEQLIDDIYGLSNYKPDTSDSDIYL